MTEDLIDRMRGVDTFALHIAHTPRANWAPAFSTGSH
jgi:hypothetical protein